MDKQQLFYYVAQEVYDYMENFMFYNNELQAQDMEKRVRSYSSDMCEDGWEQWMQDVEQKVMGMLKNASYEAAKLYFNPEFLEEIGEM